MQYQKLIKKIKQILQDVGKTAILAGDVSSVRALELRKSRTISTVTQQERKQSANAYYIPEPKVEDVAPKAGVGDAPKAGELPNGEEDGVPNVGVDCCWPNAAVDVVPNVGADCCWPKAPVDVVPKSELPVCAPKVVVGLPNGFGAKVLLAAGVAWPNPCWVPNEFWPNGLVDDCPNAAMKIAHMSDETIINQEKQHCEKYTLQADM
jgi:hypothetical protein